MHRINTSGSVSGHFQNGNPGTGSPATVLDAAWGNSVQDEIASVVEAAGIALDTGNDAQLLAALRLLVPPGLVHAYAGTVVPAGWYECNGQALLRTGATGALFAAIGFTYGTPDSTHFNLPDLRGEFIRGWDHGRGTDAGRAVGTWQDYATAVPKTNAPLKHTPSGDGSFTSAGNPSTIGFARAANSGESVTISTPADASEGAPGEVDQLNVATGDAETRPVNVAMMYIIKA